MKMRRRKHRRGFTLRELSVAMTLGSTVMVIAASMLTSAFDWASTAKARRQDDQTYFRLQGDLRSDIHLATDAATAESSLQLSHVNDTTIVYQIADRSISRQESRGGEVIRREQYRWKADRAPSFPRGRRQQSNQALREDGDALRNKCDANLADDLRHARIKATSSSGGNPMNNTPAQCLRQQRSTNRRWTNCSRRNRRWTKRGKDHRQGGIIFGVLACLAVVTAIVALLARDALAARRETKLRLQVAQTQRLLDAGILRAAIKLRADDNYEGEAWTPELVLGGQPVPTAVEISKRGDELSVTARIGQSPNITTKSHTFSPK